MYMLSRIIFQKRGKGQFQPFCYSAVAINWHSGLWLYTLRKSVVALCLITGKTAIGVHAIVLTIPYFCGILNARIQQSRVAGGKRSKPPAYIIYDYAVGVGF